MGQETGEYSEIQRLSAQSRNPTLAHWIRGPRSERARPSVPEETKSQLVTKMES